MALGSATLLTAPTLEALAAQRRRVAPSDRLRIGLIGANGMGFSNLTSILKQPDVQCVALCDVDESVRNKRATDTEKLQSSKPKLYDDYRRLLDDRDIDAVIIGTPDHWHCLIACDALSAGRHVYVEKPLANSVEECNTLMKVAARYPRQMVQVGQWQRSGTHYEKAIDYVRSGKLGQIRLVKVWAYQGWMKPVPVQPDGPAPAGVNYDMLSLIHI